MPRPTQQTLFEAPDADPVDGTMVVMIERQQSELGKSQKRFNQLTTKIRDLRAELCEWNAYVPRYAERVASELVPTATALNDARRAVLLRIDVLLARPKELRLPQRMRRSLSTLLMEQAEALLQELDDPELEELLTRHCGMDRKQREAARLESAKAVLGELYGEHAVADHEADDPAELLRQIHERMDAEALQREQARQERAQKRRAARGGRPTRAEQQAAQREQARLEAGMSLREIYRKLASALHPDRSRDAADADTRTALMKRANQAYEAADLLGLLELQIEVEQIATQDLAGLSEQKLLHYNEVLREQLQVLEAQISGVVDPLLEPLQTPLRGKPTVAKVEKALLAETADMHSMLVALQEDLEDLDDPQRCRSVLEAVCDMADEDAEFARILDLLAPGPPPPRGSRAKPKRPGRRR